MGGCNHRAKSAGGKMNCASLEYHKMVLNVDALKAHLLYIQSQWHTHLVPCIYLLLHVCLQRSKLVNSGMLGKITCWTFWRREMPLFPPTRPALRHHVLSAEYKCVILSEIKTQHSRSTLQFISWAAFWHHVIVNYGLRSGKRTLLHCQDSVRRPGQIYWHTQSPLKGVMRNHKEDIQSRSCWIVPGRF